MPFDIPKPSDTIEQAGTYPATLERVEEGPDFGNGPTRKWHWLVEENGQIKSISVLTSQNTGPKSDSYKWLTALLGSPPQAGTRIEDPTGVRVLLQLTINDNGYPKVAAVLPFQEPQQTIPGIPR